MDFRFNRDRIRKRGPENSKAGAQAYESVLRQKLARGESVDGLDKKSELQEQKFAEFAWPWFNTYVETNNKPSEISHKKYILRLHLIPFFGTRPINKISGLQIEEYKAKKVREGLTNKTINNHLTVLRKCLNTAQDWFDLEKIPKISQLKVPPYKVDFLLKEECELLLSNLTGLWREISLTALTTGLRHGELRALDWSDINWTTRILTVRHSWCGCKKGLVAPKSNRERHIPLDDELYRVLIQRRQTTGYIFLDERGEKFNGRRLNKELSNACRKSDIRRVKCHILRHTFASHLIMAGASLKAIQELMGHADIQTTMRYTHLAPSSLRATIDLLRPKQQSIVNFGQPVVNSEKQPLSVLSGNKAA